MRPTRRNRADKRRVDRALRDLDTHGSGYATSNGEVYITVRVADRHADLAERKLRKLQLSTDVEIIETTAAGFQPRDPYRSQANPDRKAPRRRNFKDTGLIGSIARKLKDVHPPPDPSIDVLPPDALAFWEAARDDAFDYYSRSGAPKAHEVAERTAWRAVRMHWEAGRPKWKRRRPSLKLPARQLTPEPGGLVTLGKLLEYGWINEDGSLEVRGWQDSPPDLYWDKESKTLFAFPNSPDVESCKPIPQDMEDEAHMFKRWSQRQAKCLKEFSVTAEESIVPMGVADSVAYRSDKWHAQSSDPYLEDSQEYFHQHTDGGFVWQDRETNPNVIIMRGGQLDVEERGIIH